MQLLKMMGWRRGFARFRSDERMRATDLERYESIRVAIRLVIASIDAESQGLQRRLHEAETRATALSGTDSQEYPERSAEDDKLLAEAEREIVGAYKRLSDLVVHRRVLDRKLLEFGDDTLSSASPHPGTSGLVAPGHT